MDQIERVLSDLGFEDREIKIYLLLLRDGDLSALQIARKTRIDRTTTYDILERMHVKGLISQYIKNNAKQFKALLPKELLSNIKEKYYSLEQILPELNHISNNHQDKASCQLFQGKEGIKIVLRDLIESKKDYKVIGIKKDYEDLLGFFNDAGIIELNQIKVKEFGLVEDGSNFTKLKNGEYRYLAKELLSPVTTLIYGNHVAFFIWTEPHYVIRIESKQIKVAQEQYFDLLWKIAKK